MNETLDYNDSLKLREELTKMSAENKRLKEQLAMQRIMFEHAWDAMFMFDKKLKIIHANEAAIHLMQLKKDQLINRSLFDFLPGFSNSKLDLKRFNEKGHYKKDVCVKLDNGTSKHLEMLLKKIDGEDWSFAVLRDISSKKILERERSINEQLFKDLFLRAVDGIVIFDNQGNFIDANRSFCQSFHIEKKDLSKLKLDLFIREPFKKKLRKIWETLDAKGRAKGELPVTLFSGDQKLFEFTITSNIISGFYMSIMRDITEKRNMEIQLLKSEERFREVFENAMDAIIIWKKNGQIIEANRSACKIFELPMEKLLQSSFFDFIDKNDSKYKSVLKQYKQKNELRAELQFYMPNGQYKELEFTSKKIIFEDHHLTVLRNVSDRKRMEKKLRENELKFRKVFNGAMDGFLLFDNNNEIIDANPVAGEILNLPLQKIKESRITDLISKYEVDHAASADRVISLNEKNNEIPIILKQEEDRILEFSYKRNIIHNMNLALFRDITERKELEERLRKSDTLHVVGELAAGIAHEIRNPMTALKGFIQLLKSSIEGDYALYFNVITSELKRIESIITEFLILAKPQAIMYEERTVTQIMRDTIDLLYAQANLSNVQIHLDIFGEIPDIYCEPNQLKQVFINILKNAIEVMPSGGNIYVAIKSVDDHHICISMTDEGSGISEDKLKRLGEPFYTTKERGTGLGLMVSYKIMKEHQGKIEVESEEGKGTSFYLTLPIRQKIEEESIN